VPPTGLAIIRRLSPASDLLASRLEDLYSEFVPLDYGEIETDKAQRLNRIDSRWSEIEAVLSVR
jgi:hypothetical protein